MCGNHCCQSGTSDQANGIFRSLWAKYTGLGVKCRIKEIDVIEDVGVKISLDLR